MIKLLFRTINQDGGFLWIDVLKDSLEQLPDGSYKMDSDIYSMILNSAESRKAACRNT